MVLSSAQAHAIQANWKGGSLAGGGRWQGGGFVGCGWFGRGMPIVRLPGGLSPGRQLIISLTIVSTVEASLCHEFSIFVQNSMRPSGTRIISLALISFSCLEISL
eukprot:GHVO01066305.1.p1 GENE.GHVO01066305.1~~GHVO01066305.1.p1  ORF type:complete len:112 (+),score=7.23 GHVO01066305.1:23-337(+)